MYATFSTPLYSNMGISILAMAIEAATKKNLVDLMHERIFEPVGMKLTTLETGPAHDSSAFIPVNETIWGQTLGMLDP